MLVATVLTVYGIETFRYTKKPAHLCIVATVLTVYGIETQHLRYSMSIKDIWLQQYLSFTVLKLRAEAIQALGEIWSCNSTYRLRY